MTYINNLRLELSLLNNKGEKAICSDEVLKTTDFLSKYQFFPVDAEQVN